MHHPLGYTLDKEASVSALNIAATITERYPYHSVNVTARLHYVLPLCVPLA